MHGPFIAVDVDGVAHDHVPGEIHRDQRGGQFRLAHVRAHGEYPALLHVQGEHLQPAAGHEGDLRLVGEAALVHVLADAAGGVAAHLGLAAVCVEDAHAEIRRLAGLDEHQAVGAHAEVGPAHLNGQGSGVADGFLKAVDVNIVVAGTVHFGEAHGRCYLLDERR